MLIGPCLLRFIITKNSVVGSIPDGKAALYVELPNADLAYFQDEPQVIGAADFKGLQFRHAV